MIINGKTYEIPDLSDFETVCRLEEQGINLMGIAMDGKEKFSNAPFCTLREVFAGLMGVDISVAGKELSAHIKNGGSFEELVETMNEEFEKLYESGTDSGFTEEGVKTPQDHKKKAPAKTTKKVTPIK